MKTLLYCTLVSALLANPLTMAANYDESKVPKYTLPDPLEGVKEAGDWTKKRAEIYQLIERECFGKAPPRGPVKILEKGAPVAVLDGRATMSQPLVEFAGHPVRLLVFTPAGAKGPVPAFMGYNFGGNHTVFADPRVALAVGWVRGGKGGKSDDSQRGKSAGRWDVAQIIDAGFGLVTLYYGDVEPDDKAQAFKVGVHRGVEPAADEWGSIAAWAWGLSHVLDYLGSNPVGIDANKVAVIGHSRLGKTSLWAGASDERFALVISNNSGCGGAALSRRAFGETVKRINTSFPHWFCGNYKKYNDNEQAAAFDMHMLMALIAPRPLYVASAEQDRWADPRGEFLSCVGADPVYRLLGTAGLASKEFPAVDKPIAAGRIAYHIRTGKHDVTAYDWKQYIAFAARHLK